MYLKIKFNKLLLLIIVLFFFGLDSNGQHVTTATLLKEMVNMKRLAELPGKNYKYIQFSSYDRRSKNNMGKGWFANSDGFRDEPIPGFEDVLEEPGDDGIGKYLICDVKGPGAILRLWTARMNGEITLFLDGNSKPVYKGDSQDFFWKTAEKLSNGVIDSDMGKALRQFDATYFPISFAKHCRIEWEGSIKKLHFYHIGIRLYEPSCKVLTFSPGDIPKYLPDYIRVCSLMDVSGQQKSYSIEGVNPVELAIPASTKKNIFKKAGSGAIELLSLKIDGGDMNTILRQNILNIYFDGSPTPQVQSPVGDFFGSAPGVNPYQSMPFSIYPDGTMECRFFMPYKDSVRIEIDNASSQEVSINGKIKTSFYKWLDGESMHFRAKWRINHNLTASDSNIIDVPYLFAIGQGRVVGAATYLLNPSNAPRSYGNWWGEGDEKIFVDGDTFPSFFGTGTEDYYNYSWSSPDIFSFAYSGQPRNDGPGNRGFVSNYRWHIFDDIPFNDKLAFYIELLHHGEVPGFAYGRMVYLYALPGLLDDHMAISGDDIREQSLTKWNPIAFKGAAGYRFYNAEELNSNTQNTSTEEDVLWAGGKILMWLPKQKGEKISIQVPCSTEEVKDKLGVTFAHLPDGGEVSVYVNGTLTKFGGEEVLNLKEPYHKVLRNYTSIPLILIKGNNDVTLEYVGSGKDQKIGVDFFWVKELDKP